MPTTRYTPDTFEQECICLLYTWLAENGFQNPDLPPIYLSFETPPKFKEIPQDWRKIFTDDIIWNGLQNKKDIDWNIPTKEQKELLEKFRNLSDVIEIDNVLGLYCHEGIDGKTAENNYKDVPEIVLYAQGITAAAKRLNVPTEVLRAVVLVHEIGHWISYVIQHNNSVNNTNVLSIIGEEKEDAKEMWAQIFPFWVAEKIQDLFKLTFELLNTNQRAAYHTFKTFKGEKKTDMMYVLKTYHRGIKNEQKISKCEEYEKLLDSEKLMKSMLEHSIYYGSMPNIIINSGIF